MTRVQSEQNVVLEQVMTFCNTMVSSYGAGFRHQALGNGIKIIGEYPTFTGEIYSVIINAYPQRVDISIYDTMRRKVYTDSMRTNINERTKLINFINKSVNR